MVQNKCNACKTMCSIKFAKIKSIPKKFAFRTATQLCNDQHIKFKTLYWRKYLYETFRSVKANAIKFCQKVTFDN